MTPDVALEKRNEILKDGFCVIEDVVPEVFLQEMRDETERLIANHQEPADLVYQGQHIGMKREDNPVIDKLLSWEPSYRVLDELGFGDFQTSGSIIILTKEAKGPPLYWHQDWMRWNDPISLSPWPQTIFVFVRKWICSKDFNWPLISSTEKVMEAASTFAGVRPPKTLSWW